MWRSRGMIWSESKSLCSSWELTDPFSPALWTNIEHQLDNAHILHTTRLCSLRPSPSLRLSETLTTGRVCSRLADAEHCSPLQACARQNTVPRNRHVAKNQPPLISTSLFVGADVHVSQFLMVKRESYQILSDTYERGGSMDWPEVSECDPTDTYSIWQGWRYL